MAGDRRLLDCLASLEAQTLPSVQIVVVDNSGSGRFHSLGAARFRFRLIENRENVGFGAAINQGFRLAPAPFLATLNDDAVADPRWLESSLSALLQNPQAGMAAARITLSGGKGLDSAGMLIARDGSSKQRGHGRDPQLFSQPEAALLPSGCAAVYRAAMLSEIGLFADDFFLYCEDTDLGLRAQWAGWHCLYVPEAQVTHHYSQSAGPASQRKAWFVERNRLRLVIRCFPLSWLLTAPAYAAMRYFWHVVSIAHGQGKAAEFHQAGGPFWQLPWLVIKAHLHLLKDLPTLLRQRAAIVRRRSSAGFKSTLRRHHISVRQVAAL
jgi:GT2 family glycosyltransferase